MLKVGLFYSEKSLDHKPMEPEVWESITQEEYVAGRQQHAIGSVPWNAGACSSERPERVLDTWDELHDSGLVDRCQLLPNDRLANEEELRRVHTPEHVAAMATLMVQPSAADLMNAQMRSNFVFFGSKTAECAALAAGGCLQVVDSVLSREC